MSKGPPHTRDTTDTFTGLFFMGVAALFAWGASDLTLGTAFRMGPGFFPLILSGVLFLLGAVILLRSFRASEAPPFGALAWRGMALILAAPVFFGFTVRGLGFVPALFFTSLIAAGASKRMSFVMALALATVVTIASTLIFSYALGLPFRRFGPWLNF